MTKHDWELSCTFSKATSHTTSHGEVVQATLPGGLPSVLDSLWALLHGSLPETLSFWVLEVVLNPSTPDQVWPGSHLGKSHGSPSPQRPPPPFPWRLSLYRMLAAFKGDLRAVGPRTWASGSESRR